MYKLNEFLIKTSKIICQFLTCLLTLRSIRFVYLTLMTITETPLHCFEFFLTSRSSLVSWILNSVRNLGWSFPLRITLQTQNNHAGQLLVQALICRLDYTVMQSLDAFLTFKSLWIKVIAKWQNVTVMFWYYNSQLWFYYSIVLYLCSTKMQCCLRATVRKELKMKCVYIKTR